MPAHMTLKKPKKGAATAARRSRKRAADRVLSKNAATVRERDGRRCRVYGTTGWLEVHHIVKRSQGGTHDTSNLVLLSKRAHDEVHAGTLRIAGDADDVLVMTWSHGRSMLVSATQKGVDAYQEKA